MKTAARHVGRLARAAVAVENNNKQQHSDIQTDDGLGLGKFPGSLSRESLGKNCGYCALGLGAAAPPPQKFVCEGRRRQLSFILLLKEGQSGVLKLGEAMAAGTAAPAVCQDAIFKASQSKSDDGGGDGLGGHAGDAGGGRLCRVGGSGALQLLGLAGGGAGVSLVNDLRRGRGRVARGRQCRVKAA